MEKIRFATEVTNANSVELAERMIREFGGNFSATEVYHRSGFDKKNNICFFIERENDTSWIGRNLSKPDFTGVRIRAESDNPFLFLSKYKVYITDVPHPRTMTKKQAEVVEQLPLFGEYFKNNEYSILTFKEVRKVLKNIKNMFEGNNHFRSLGTYSMYEQELAEVLNRLGMRVDTYDAFGDYYERLLPLFEGFDENITFRWHLQRKLNHQLSRVAIVHELPGDIRVAAIECHGEVEIVMALPTSEEYDFLDEGRFVLRGKHFFGEGITPEYIFKNWYNLLEVVTTGTSSVLTQEVLRNLLRAKQLEEFRAKRLTQIELAKEANFRKNMENIEKKKFTLENIEYGANYVQYEDARVEFVSNTALTLYRELANEISVPEDFNELVITIAARLANKVTHSNRPYSVRVRMGNVPLELTRYITDGGSKCNKINGKRINKGDYKDMITNAMCFRDAVDYETFLKSVSKLSLEMHNVLAEGLQYNKLRGTDGQPLPAKFIVERDHEKKENYLVWEEVVMEKGKPKNKERLIPIRHLRALINRSHLGYRTDYGYGDIRTILRDHTGMSFEDANEYMLFSQGYCKEEREKQLEHMKKEMQLLGVTQDDVTIGGEKQEVYVVTGISGNQYYVTKHAKVYDARTKRYICIVDFDNNNTHERIMARLYALRNDSRVAQHVHTLKV